MSEQITLRSFPNNEFEALAMLYVQQKDLSAFTPEQLLDEYQKAYDKVRIRYNETHQERRTVGWTLE